MPIALVTGVTGQDGSYLAEALRARGYHVHGLVMRPDPLLAPLLAGNPDLVVHEGDLGRPDDLHALVAEVEPDEIYNLGGISSVAFSWQQPELTTRISGSSVGSLLEAAWQLQQRRGRPVRFVQASSAEIFGAAEQSPQTELTPIRPVSPYGAAKALAHHLVGVYRGQGLVASACVLYNHESPRRPDTFVTRKITKAAARIAAGDPEPLRIGNLDARRDWGWAPDYVEAMMRAASHDQPGDYVIATGVAHSVGEFIAAAFARVGIDDWRAHVQLDPTFARPTDAPEQVGDATKAGRVLRWAPRLGFTELVAAMVDADVAELAAVAGPRGG
jgi:GDPmannose 4,6-dehydratase